MNADREARRFLDQLRAQTQAELGTPPAVADLIASRFPDYRENPGRWATLEGRVTRWLDGVYDSYIDELAKAQVDVEETAASTMMGLDLGQRPLVGHLRTGHIHAVTKLARADFEDTAAEPKSSTLWAKLSAITRSTRLLVQSDPGRMPVRMWLSEVRRQAGQVKRRRPYLILIEDQLSLFVEQFGSIVARAIPRHPSADSTGRKGFIFSVPHVTQWIEAHPEIADLFTEVVVAYAVRASLSVDFNVVHETPPDHAGFAKVLQTSLRYFVLGHEYAHILFGHLEKTAPNKNVLPVTDAEALKYSWQQELEADSFGMMIALNAAVGRAKLDHPTAFLGICLYLDAMDVMDRAVAVLETGDEDLRQIGSHPPAYRRKRGVRRTLAMMVEADGDGTADPVQAMMRNALEMEEIQAEIIRLLWERTRPVLLDLWRRGVRAAPMWRIVWKDTGDQPAPVWTRAPQTTAPPPTTELTQAKAPPTKTSSAQTTFLVTEVWDLPSRGGLMVSGKTLTGKVRSGMTLRNDAGHTTQVLSLEFLSPRDIANGEVTIMVARTDPSPVHRQALLTADPTT